LAVLAMLAAISVGPMVYVVWASFRESGGNSGFTLSNWNIIFNSLPIGTGLGNSAILAGGTTLVILLFAPLAAFGFAKLPFPGSQACLYGAIGTLMVPAISIIIPIYSNFSKIHWIGFYPGTILVYGAFNLGFAVMMFNGFFRSVPDHIVESGLIDGASYVRIYSRLVLPIAAPALLLIGILTFMNVWNDFLVALLFMPQGNRETFNVMLATLFLQRAGNYPVNAIFAGAVISFTVPVLVFMAFSRRLINGFTLMLEG
jgi:ABC-type glycerol-3-phosphate transport system permease component